MSCECKLRVGEMIYLASSCIDCGGCNEADKAWKGLLRHEPLRTKRCDVCGIEFLANVDQHTCMCCEVCWLEILN